MQKSQKRPLWLVSEGRIFHGVRSSRAFTWADTGEAAPPPTQATPKQHLTGLLRAAKLPPRDHVKYQEQLEKLSPQALESLSIKVRQTRANRKSR